LDSISAIDYKIFDGFQKCIVDNTILTAAGLKEVHIVVTELDAII
jgi:hypothetical protein